MKKKMWILTYLFFTTCPLTNTTENKQPDTTAETEKNNPSSFDETIFNWTRTFAEVVHTAGKKHYRINDAENCMIKAIDGFLNCLDPHSNFLDPKTYKSIQESTSGQFFGVGIVMDNTRQAKDKALLVVDTVPEGPSDKSGIKPLDKIVEIDGESLEGMTNEEIMIKLKGEKNTTVTVKILRDNHPDLIVATITRDVIKDQNSLSFELTNFDIYYISLTSFTETAAKQIEKLLKEGQKKNHKGLILDLRNNSGGLLTSALDIAGLFLEKESEVVSTKNKNQEITDVYKTKRKPVTDNSMPIVILINNYTASAAEILAGSLKIHSEKQTSQDKNIENLRVFLVGKKTFGKGSVQEVIPVGNNCAMKVTTSLYYLPFDTAIQGMGIEPDFLIEKKLPPTEQMIWFNKYYGSEQALNNSIKSQKTEKAEKKESDKEKDKNKKDEKEKTWSERMQEHLAKDNQLKDAVTLINLFNTAQNAFPEKVKTRADAIAFMKSIYVADEPLALSQVKI